MDDLRDQTAVVTGGSRGFGRGIVEALAGAGMRVVAVARDPGGLAALAREVKGRVETVAGDATDPVTAARVIDRERPRVLVLNAGATGPHRPTRLQTWETFSVFWQTDVRSAFLWLREALDATIRYAWKMTGGVPLLVTENGIATDNDAERIEYVKRALSGVLACLADGIDVRGYVYWSLLDNFEWAFGYRPKFGLVAVDRATQARRPKPSAAWLGRVARAGALVPA